MAGALSMVAGCVKSESVNWALENQLPEKIKKTIPINMEALELGKQRVEKTIK